jgi:hypothetical protein
MIGPLFMLSEDLAKRGVSILGYFGDAFEEYTKMFLRKICNETGEKLLLDDDVKVNGDETCDACIVSGDKLLLFEMKAVWIRDDQVADQDHMRYLLELRQKYGNGKNAAYQLARAVNYFTSGKWKLKGFNICDIKQIYPILVAYDPTLNTPGHSWFFSSEFREALKFDAILEKSKIRMAISQWVVAPITTMTVDILEDLETSVKNFKLSDLLRDYITYCDRHFRDIDDDFSLLNFIHVAYESKIDRHGIVAGKAQEQFHKMIELLVGNQSSS